MLLIKVGKWGFLQYQICIIPSCFVKMKIVVEKTNANKQFDFIL